MDLVTADFLLFSGILVMIVSIVIYAAYLRSKNKVMLYLSMTFFFIASHGLSLSAPILIDANDNALMQVSLILASGFFFLALISGLEVLIFLRGHKASKNLQKFSSFVLVILGAYSVAVLFITTPHVTITGSSDIIIWNLPKSVAAIVSASCVIYGILWSIICFHAAELIKNDAQRFKITVLAVDGVLFGLAGFLGYASFGPAYQMASLIIFFFASIVSVVTFLLPQKIFVTSQ